jgi:hypothetical protein
VTASEESLTNKFEMTTALKLQSGKPLGGDDGPIGVYLAKEEKGVRSSLSPNCDVLLRKRA